MGSSLFLISRGVVRVSRQMEGEEKDLATLLSGDFFGEMTLLHEEPRTATCRSMTPCVLYELQRHDFEQFVRSYPKIRETIAEIDSQRRLSLQKLSDHKNGE